MGQWQEMKSDQKAANKKPRNLSSAVGAGIAKKCSKEEAKLGVAKTRSEDSSHFTAGSFNPDLGNATTPSKSRDLKAAAELKNEMLMNVPTSEPSSLAPPITTCLNFRGWARSRTEIPSTCIETQTMFSVGTSGPDGRMLTLEFLQETEFHNSTTQ